MGSILIFGYFHFIPRDGQNNTEVSLKISEVRISFQRMKSVLLPTDGRFGPFGPFQNSFKTNLRLLKFGS